LTDWDRRAFNAVEVRLGLLVELFAALLVEVVSAFDQDGALIRLRLTLVELVAGRRVDGAAAE
jgi:hypothetical protein